MDEVANVLNSFVDEVANIRNILAFVTRHGTAVRHASINIVFGCKQEQQYSRKHHFIRAVNSSAQNDESHWSHVQITYTTVEHFRFSCIS